jgi:hypothetical protein
LNARTFFHFRRELFQTKVKIHKRLFVLLLVFALVIGLLPSVLADNEPDISAADSAEEMLVDSQPEESPAIGCRDLFLCQKGVVSNENENP